jgi:hypothetical protein
MWSFLTFKFVLDSSFSKYLKMMSIMMIFFNAHARVYVQWASLIPCPLCKPLWKQKNLQCPCPPGIGCFKNFQCPCPPGFTNGFFLNCPARLVWLKANTGPTLGSTNQVYVWCLPTLLNWFRFIWWKEGMC